MDLIARLDRVVDTAIADTKIVGSVTLVGQHGKLVYARAAGWFDREANSAMRRDAIFRLASVTKPIVASTALAMIERRLIGLDHAVADYLPAFRPRLKDGSAAKVLIRHLLSHSSGLTYSYPEDPRIDTGLFNFGLGMAEFIERVAAVPLRFAPGTGWDYGVNIDVLGAVIAAVHGGTLEEAVTHYVTKPLGMIDTAFHVVDRARLAPPYADGVDGAPPTRMGARAQVLSEGNVTTFETERIFNAANYQSGGAGMAGTADDVFRLLDTLRVGGGDILRPETVEMATANQVGTLPRRDHDAGQRFGFLGAVLDDPQAARSPQARGTFRWGGVYGHDWSVDPANGLTILVMTNTAVEGCTGVYPKLVRNAVYGA
jgi:CubicO group peptidase (beta-lactamase class C family)